MKYYKHACILALFQPVIYFHLWPVWPFHIFPHYLINGTIFGKNHWTQMCIFVSSTSSAWNIYHSVKKSLRYYHKCTQVLMQSTCYFYQILIKLEFPQHILKNTHVSNFVKIQPVGAELFHVDRQTRWRDRHDEAKSHSS